MCATTTKCQRPPTSVVHPSRSFRTRHRRASDSENSPSASRLALAAQCSQRRGKHSTLCLPFANPSDWCIATESHPIDCGGRNIHSQTVRGTKCKVKHYSCISVLYITVYPASGALTTSWTSPEAGASLGSGCSQDTALPTHEAHSKHYEGSNSLYPHTSLVMLVLEQAFTIKKLGHWASKKKGGRGGGKEMRKRREEEVEGGKVETAVGPSTGL